MGAEPRFGQGIDYYEILNKAVAETPKLSAIEARQYLRDLYDRVTGIYSPKEAEGRPLIGVAMHKAEDYIGYSSYRDILTEYAINDYKELWGLSINDFLALPAWKVKVIREQTPLIRAEKKKQIDAIIAAQNHDLAGS